MFIDKVKKNSATTGNFPIIGLKKEGFVSRLTNSWTVTYLKPYIFLIRP